MEQRRSKLYDKVVILTVQQPTTNNLTISHQALLPSTRDFEIIIFICSVPSRSPGDKPVKGGNSINFFQPFSNGNPNFLPLTEIHFISSSENNFNMRSSLTDN